MSTIAALVENFTGAAAGIEVSTTNTIFDNVAGPGSSTIIVDPFLGGTNRMMQVGCAAQLRAHAMDFPAQLLLWFTFDLDIGTPPDATTAIFNGYQTSAATAAEKVFDLRIVGGTRQLNLRSINTAVWTSSALAAGTKYQVSVMVKLGASARRLRVMVLSADGASVLQDSGEITATANISTISHVKLGALSDNTSTLRYGRLRGDDSTGPTVSVPATVTLGADQTGIEPGATVTLMANTTGGGGGAVSFTQTAGPTVALSGTGSTRTFTAPAYWGSGQTSPAGPVLTFQAAYGAATATVNVTPYPHLRWRKGVSGWQPVYPQRRST